MRKPAAIAAVVLLTLTAGCGGGRPSAEDVSKALQKGVASTKDKDDKLKLTKKQADCVAKKFVASDFTDEVLQQMVDDGTVEESKANEKVVDALDVEECMT